ncbi:MAG: molybdopterin molybdenumtransferase MoeA [Lysobacter sp.]|nr:MAG: molybdopterin molybdenumtransferase MoeA [Lysobacter sp.]
MIDYEDALARVLAEAPLLPPEQMPTEQALGRILASNIVSPGPLPPFDNSAMDGFALPGGAGVVPAGSEFDVEGECAAGEMPAVTSAGAWEVMTGACMPFGCDAIVPIEQVEVVSMHADGRPARIRLQVDVPRGQHLRHAGEDVGTGERVAVAGDRVDAAMQTLLIALGVAGIDARRRPRVVVITTGRELVADPAIPLRPGQIRDSNACFLRARLQAAGAEVVGVCTIGDDADVFSAHLRDAMSQQVDIVVSTGAVSMGRYDFIPDALTRAGANVLFHKVRMRPGKPILAARLCAGMLFFGLPGNPASTAVGMRFFVEPVIRAMLGMSTEQPLLLPLAARYEKRPALRMHLKARVRLDTDGRLGVHLLDGQESFRIRPLLEANAWAVIAADVKQIDAGTCVQVVGRGHLEPIELT